MNVFVKKLTHLPVLELTLFRSVFTFIVCFFLIRRKNIPYLGSRRPVLFLRGIFGSISLILFFYSVHHLPLATATLVHYITPFFTTLFGFIFLGERFYKMQWLFLMVCFAGIAITQGSNTGDLQLNTSNLGLMAGLGACIAAAAAYNCIRKIGISEDPNVILIYFSLITLPVSLVLLLMQGNFIPPSPTDWLFILFMGILTQAAQFFMTRAYQGEHVGTIAIFTNMGILYAIVNGMLFFDEIPSLRAWMGIAIVIAGIVLNFIYTGYINKKTPDVALPE